MRIGICVTNFSWPGPASDIGPRVAWIARTADEAGFDSLWTMDHLFPISLSGLPREAPMLEAYSTLAFIAGQTRRIRLGALVTSVAYRYPGILIKAVTTLDVLSGGRMVLGIGAGAPSSLAGDAEGLGIPFPSQAERYERLEEVLQIARQMWRGDERPIHGRHYRLPRPLNFPNSLQRPHPPILVGGSGEQVLRLVAKYADACNLFDVPGRAGDIRHKLDELEGHCRDVGRDHAEIEKTAATYLELGEDRPTDLSRFVAHLQELGEVGVEHVLVAPSPPHPWDAENLSAIASIVPVAHDLPTRRRPFQ